MRIAIMVAIGLVLVATIYVVAAIVMGPEGSSRRVARGGAGFILVWIVVSAVDFGIGLNAGYSAATEAAAHAAIFGIPALAAWGLALLASRDDPRPPGLSGSALGSGGATLCGFGAAALWALLGLLTAATGPVPPFQLLAMTFGIAGLLGMLSWTVRPEGARALRQPWPVWLLGVGGLFGYHALYFAALKLAPPADASLIAYLWPLLIVLLSATLPGERLLARHVVGALFGLAGVVALAIGRGIGGGEAAAWPGYACALACAFVWSGYSVLSRRVASVPTDAVTGFCLATAALGLLCHLAFETTAWPSSGMQWTAIVLNGIGPVGAAFYLWDIGMKRGDIRLLGVGSYAIPVASTLVLVAAGFADATVSLGLACLLIAAGAVVATYRRRTVTA